MLEYMWEKVTLNHVNKLIYSWDLWEPVVCMHGESSSKD